MRVELLGGICKICEASFYYTTEGPIFVEGKPFSNILGPTPELCAQNNCEIQWFLTHEQMARIKRFVKETGYLPEWAKRISHYTLRIDSVHTPWIIDFQGLLEDDWELVGQILGWTDIDLQDKTR